MALAMVVGVKDLEEDEKDAPAPLLSIPVVVVVVAAAAAVVFVAAWMPSRWGVGMRYRFVNPENGSRPRLPLPRIESLNDFIAEDCIFPTPLSCARIRPLMAMQISHRIDPPTARDNATQVCMVHTAYGNAKRSILQTTCKKSTVISQMDSISSQTKLGSIVTKVVFQTERMVSYRKSNMGIRSDTNW